MVLRSARGRAAMSRATPPPRGMGARGRELILVFGEDPNDTAAISTLTTWLNPRIGIRYKVEPRRDPPSLTRHADELKTRDWLTGIASLVAKQEAAGRRVHAVLVHQDADGVDASGRVEANLNRRLAEVFEGRPAHAVVPVSMSEAWWIMFPDAVRSVKKQAWRDLKLPTGDVEQIQHAKSYLKSATRKVAPKNTYSEGDSMAIAHNIVAQNKAPACSSKSWERYKKVCQSLA